MRDQHDIQWPVARYRVARVSTGCSKPLASLVRDGGLLWGSFLQLPRPWHARLSGKGVREGKLSQMSRPAAEGTDAKSIGTAHGSRPVSNKNMKKVCAI